MAKRATLNDPRYHAVSTREDSVTNIAQKLADLEVEDLEGGRVALGSLWADRPAVVAFIRHFG